jgi:fluoride ion exporter CrcB/FEX
VKNLSAVAAGGTAGALSRYLISETLSSYPISIFIANLVGVAIAGFVAFRLTPTELNKLFWIPGFAGGMTTFSSIAVIHAERSDLLSIAYFFGTVAASLLILYALAPKVVR